MKLIKCKGCGQRKPYDADKWRNYSSKPGSRTVYVCEDCADDPEVIERIERGE